MTTQQQLAAAEQPVPVVQEQALAPAPAPQGCSVRCAHPGRLAGGAGEDNALFEDWETRNVQRLTQQLKGKRVVLVATGGEGKTFVFVLAKLFGMKIIVLDTPAGQAFATTLLEKGLIERFVPVEPSDQKTFLECASDALSALKQQAVQIDGVYSFAELVVQEASTLAAQMGLPHLNLEAVRLSRNKLEMRRLLRERGLPQPTFHRIDSEEDCNAAAALVRFPAVLKPISGAASIGVKKVECRESLLEAYQEMMATIQNTRVVNGALVQEGDAGTASGTHFLGTAMMLEEYLEPLEGDADGTARWSKFGEVDVDVVMSKGVCVYAAVSDNGPTQEPFFNETWAVTPSLYHNQHRQEELQDLAVRVLQVLGHTDGVFHVEAKSTPAGPQTIEVNCRMGGGPVHISNLHAWGVDLVGESLCFAVGIPSSLTLPRFPLACVANCDVNAMETGVLADDSFMQPVFESTDVLRHDQHVKAEDKVVGPEDGLPTWLVELVVKAADPSQALERIHVLTEQVQRCVRLRGRQRCVRIRELQLGCFFLFRAAGRVFASAKEESA